MNEPSNFLDGSTSGCPTNNLENPPYTPGRRLDLQQRSHYKTYNTFGFHGVFCFQVYWEVCWEPKPCVPPRSRSSPYITTCTVCMDWWKLKPLQGLMLSILGCTHATEIKHYNTSSLHTLSCCFHFLSVPVFSALKRIVAKRPFVISRSTFPSQGMYSGHWLGDNRSQWKDLYTSIAGQKFSRYRSYTRMHKRRHCGWSVVVKLLIWILG